MATKSRVMDPEMTFRLERAIERAVKAVDNEAGIQGGVSLAITIEHDEKNMDRVTVSYKLKTSYGDVKATEAGTLMSGQLIFPSMEGGGLDLGDLKDLGEGGKPE